MWGWEDVKIKSTLGPMLGDVEPSGYTARKLVHLTFAQS
jgi:hypothetical protein